MWQILLRSSFFVIPAIVRSSPSLQGLILNQPLASPSLWKPDLSVSQSQNTTTKPGAFEIKFLIEESELEKLIPSVAARMQLDPHAHPQTGGYTVEGIYFETLERDVFRRSPGYSRRKFRIRRYSEGPNVFLERKSKRKGIVSKRRTLLERSDLVNLLDRIFERTHPSLQRIDEETSRGQSGPSEMDWFSRRIERLKLRPLLCLSYDRVAFLQMDNSGPIRLTLDRALGCCTLEQSQFPSKVAYQPFLEGNCIVEMKYRESIPTVFREIIDEFKLVSRPVSKFRNAIVAAGLDSPPCDPASEGPN